VRVREEKEERRLGCKRKAKMPVLDPEAKEKNVS
jgi:hypothetical protein